MLAEFLVAKAVGDAAPLRVGWNNFDVLTPEGVRIEVKSSAYLQSWAQKRLSTIRFDRLTGLSWDPREAESAEREIRADLFVFAVQTCKDPALYDALDIGQWDFYVARAEAIEANGARSVGLAFLKRDAIGPATWFELNDAVGKACRGDTGAA